ncbi:DUF2790 domain-containing protein [Pseudomonas putida]|uniref:DUF2790 domain-containing protein n=1 Tax=Pseudomonas putida TaxID=303 RepID=A0A1Q9R646_PSEPU|nr:DUF2790 domain-containing protein [Pseudomonas putida]OLS62894.1 hypothetical protein PSEMO_22480 [Pseudomonas putida]
MKLRLLLPLVLLLPGAAHATQDGIPQYHYGMPLDVARVLDLREPSSDHQCQVVKATMTYLDSHGQQHQLHYLKLAEECSDQG